LFLLLDVALKLAGLLEAGHADRADMLEATAKIKRRLILLYPLLKYP
jgi:hypothetical protein